MILTGRAIFLTSLSLLLPAFLITNVYSGPVGVDVPIADMNPKKVPIETDSTRRIIMTTLGASTFKELVKVRESHNSTAPHIRVIFTIVPQESCNTMIYFTSSCDSKSFNVLRSDKKDFMVEASLASVKDLDSYCRMRTEDGVTRRIDYKGRFDVPRFEFKSFQIWFRCGDFAVKDNTVTYWIIAAAILFVMTICVIFVYICFRSGYFRERANRRQENQQQDNQQQADPQPDANPARALIDQVGSSSSSGRSNETATTHGSPHECVAMKDVTEAVKAQREKEAREAAEKDQVPAEKQPLLDNPDEQGTSSN